MSGTPANASKIVRLLRFLAHLMADGWTVPVGLLLAAVVAVVADQGSSIAAQALMLLGVSTTLFLSVRAAARDAIRANVR